MLDLDRLDRSGEYRLRDYIASAVDNMRNDLTDLSFIAPETACPVALARSARSIRNLASVGAF